MRQVCENTTIAGAVNKEVALCSGVYGNVVNGFFLIQLEAFKFSHFKSPWHGDSKHLNMPVLILVSVAATSPVSCV